MKMDQVISISKLVSGILAIVSGLYTLLSADGGVLSGLPDWARGIGIVAFVILGIFLILVSILDYVMERRKSVRRYKFKYQSDKFFKFFSDWYRQPGTLSIICDDLDWITTEENSDVYDQLLAKSRKRRLNLLMGRGIRSSAVLKLQAAGAQVMPAPAGIVSSYTFSCLSVMDDAAGKIIVRNKRGDPQPSIDEVIFQEISNTYITALLNALLKSEDRG